MKSSRFTLPLVFISLCACSPATSPPPGDPDTGVPPEPDAGMPAEDAGATPELDAGLCPMPVAGRWVIRPASFTYSGSDCRTTIESDYRPIAFTVAADGTIPSCECDWTAPGCSALLLGSLGSSCETRLDCGPAGSAGPSMYVYFVSPTLAEVRGHDLILGSCMANGTFSPE
jgi:hypothetical protein